MTDEQVNALAQACRVGAMNEREMLAIIARHHDHEKRFICTYTQSLVCGFRSDPYEGPFVWQSPPGPPPATKTAPVDAGAE